MASDLWRGASLLGGARLRALVLLACSALALALALAPAMGDPDPAAAAVQPQRRQIPRVVFRSHEQALPLLHPKFKEYLNRTMTDNPGYVQVYFDAQDRLDFIRTFYPQFLALYTSLVPGAYKSDMWRYLVMYRYGGIYNDISMRYTKPIGKVVGHERDEFVGAVDLDPTAVINGFFAAYPGHPVLLKAIELVVDNIRNLRYGCDNLDITGPRVFARAIRLFFYGRPLAPHPVRAGTYSITSCRGPRQGESGGGGGGGDYRLHMLNFTISQAHPHSHSFSSRPGAGASSSPRNVWDKVQLIVDGAGSGPGAGAGPGVGADGGPAHHLDVCIRNKFDGYLDVIYNKTSSGGEKYGTLWTEHRVYRQSLSNQQQHQVQDRYFYSNNLFRQGRSLWYLFNHTRFTFPDYQTFVDMGLQECLVPTTLSAVAAKTYSMLPQVPLASTSTGSSSGGGGDEALLRNLESIGLWGSYNCNSTVPSRSIAGIKVVHSVDQHAALLQAVTRDGGASGLVRTITYSQWRKLVELDV